MITSRSMDVKDVTCCNLCIAHPIPRNRVLIGESFSFLNHFSVFKSWNDTSYGMLWAYNLNYMDWLQQENLSVEEGIKWIDKFIIEISTNKIGLDPYPIALRGINWIKFISQYYDEIGETKRVIWNKSLYAQYLLLKKKIEYHLLGNHLLEDAYSIFIAAIYFKDKGFYEKSVKLLQHELHEQILPDGSHYEQSPMYHCILLDRLLDCYNFSVNNIHWRKQSALNDFFKEKAIQMLGHLNSVIYTDGQIPLFNDSALGIAPTPEQLFNYAKRLGLQWNTIAMKECGYRKMKSMRMEAFIDIGNITASYQPGHSHADTFNYELKIDGCPFIVDTGVSTYNKTERRQLERGTKAHNTVSINNHDSSEVWDGFRVGKRANVKILEDTSTLVTAVHDGFGKENLHTRTFILGDDSFTIHDVVSKESNAISYIHFAPGVRILSVSSTEIRTESGVIHIFGGVSVDIVEGKIAMEYNRLLPSLIAQIHFTKKCSYIIIYNN